MGLLDNTLQTESTKVVTMSNSSNSEATLGRLPMENDRHDARIGLPKYKRRSVSAIRDFPPGCGWHVPRVSSVKDDESVCISTAKSSDDLMKNGDVDGGCLFPRSEIDSQPPNVLANMRSTEIPLPTKPGNGIKSLPAMTSEDLAATDGVESKVEEPVVPTELEIGNPVDIGGVEELQSTESEKTDLPSISPNKDVPTSRNRIFPPNYPPRRKVSAVRDFPPFCGRNAVPLIHGNRSGQEPMQSDTQNGEKVLKNMEDNFQDKVANDSKNDTEMIMPDLLEETGKTHQERVQNQRELKTQVVLGLGKMSNRVSEDIEGFNMVSTSTGPGIEIKKAHKVNELTGGTSESKQTNDFTSQERHKSFAKAKKTVPENCKRVGMMEKKKKMRNSSSGGQDHNLLSASRSQNVDVTLPPSLIRSNVKSDKNDASVTRNKVRETLQLFQVVYRKIVKEDEKSKNIKRPDYAAARILREKGKYLNLNKIIGSVPGVEVGDEFQYRAELNIIGVHRPIQGGIDFVKDKGLIIATSVVASGGYDDNTDDSDVLIYTGSGGNVMDGKKVPEDQKLERGNLALKNSVDAKNPVRVIRGDIRATEFSNSRKMTYVYDGLYVVEKCWQELGPHNKLIYKFKLVRLPGQPELAWKVVKKCKQFKVREGLCVADISNGKEVTPICAVNSIDNEKPPPFEYITRVIYPDGFRPVPSRGCNCTGGCSEGLQCSCVVKNGGEIPYNRNGAIVEAKNLVYECGPHCKCPPSCYNRVSQKGIQFQLEIFKTESRGWGVRSLNSISSGSFICEYIGELLEDKEAEERKGNDEYLFDIGNNSSDNNSLWEGLSNLISEKRQESCGVVEESGFTIDAAKYGNVGRFINHSCSPNMYAQNVVYDHDDKSVPHIMFFAMENIPPLQELTYHYNYMIDQVIDSDGRVKKKICYCGSSECTGRLY